MTARRQLCRLSAPPHASHPEPGSRSVHQPGAGEPGSAHLAGSSSPAHPPPESGFRADAVHGKTWGKKGQTPVVERPGQRQSISAASAVNARGGFWYCTYQGGLNAEAFVSLLRRMMRRRSKPVHLVLDGLPAHKTTLVKAYVASTKGMLTLHFLPGYAPELNPDELVWSHMKRTGVARAPLRRGERLQAKIEAQLGAIKRMPQLIRSFFKMPSVAYITDW